MEFPAYADGNFSSVRATMSNWRYDPNSPDQQVSLLERDQGELERSKAIGRMHSQIGQVNQMFRDLSELVISQGDQLNTIESNFESSASNTKQAAEQVRVTHDRRKQLKDFILILSMILIFVVLISVYRGVKRS